MESGRILSAGPATGRDGAGGGLNQQQFGAERLRALFAAHPGLGVRGAIDPDIDRSEGAGRGDHDLNPGMLPPDSLLPAAVLVPLIARPDGIWVLLTQRTAHLSSHAGQIAFPGGRIEPDDADAVAAALRETREEVGIPADRIEPIGALDRYVTRTGFQVTPVVALLHPPFELALDPHEVADAFEVPLGFFLDPANQQIHGRDYQGVTRHFYVFPFGERYIWGATAGMLANLVEVLAPAAA